VGAGTIGDVSQDFRPVLELNPVDTVGKRLHHDPLHDWGALGHERRLYQRSVPPIGASPPPGFAGHLPTSGEATFLKQAGWRSGPPAPYP